MCLKKYKNICKVFRDIRGLEGEAVEDRMHTSSLNKLVQNLQTSVDSYRYYTL